MAGSIVIISADFNFKHSVAEALRKVTSYSVAVAGDVFQGAGLAAPGFPTMLIMDTDSLRISDTYAKTLSMKPQTLVIAVGRVNAANFLRQGLPCILSKPLQDNRFSMNIFINELKSYLDGFERTNSLGPGGMPMSVSSGAAALEGVTRRQKIIAIAASTGGTEALPVVMRELPANCPPVLIVQHMPPVFTTQFADRLNKLSQMTVKEATTGDQLRKGLALLAPGDFHMKLTTTGQFLSVDNVLTEKVHAVRPAADVLFNSMLPIIGGNCIGVILTGMGADGAAGLKSLHDKGAVVIGQDERSCIVYGMPKAAYEMGAVDYQLPLEKIGAALKEFIE